jgi:hypothetical protein
LITNGAVLGSASISSILVARLKKLSALKKNPSLGRFADLTSRKYRDSGEWDARVEKRKLMVPPSGLNPHADAIASNSVDLPLPFSPITKVTSGWKFKVRSFRTA